MQTSSALIARHASIGNYDLRLAGYLLLNTDIRVSCHRKCNLVPVGETILNAPAQRASWQVDR